MHVRKQQLELDMEKQTGSKSGKEYVKPAYCHPADLNYINSTIMWNPRLDEAQARIKNARRNSNNLRYADDTTHTTGSKEKLKSLLMKMKEEREKAGLNQHSKIMACGPITSWKIDG